jgi:hypothetical protein
LRNLWGVTLPLQGGKDLKIFHTRAPAEVPANNYPGSFQRDFEYTPQGHPALFHRMERDAISARPIFKLETARHIPVLNRDWTSIQTPDVVRLPASGLRHVRNLLARAPLCLC